MGRTGRLAVAAILIVAAAALAWWVVVRRPARTSQAVTPTPTSSGAAVPTPEGRKIKIHLFYVSASGARLTSVEQDVPYGEGPVNQAKAIITAQLAAPAAPNLSAIPPGTTLRALFITEKGEAYVDLSPEVRSAHPGGSTNELLTVYTIVNALTSNMPAVMAVQVLVDGKEVDTLSGHVDLRRPLVKNMTWVE